MYIIKYRMNLIMMCSRVYIIVLLSVNVKALEYVTNHLCKETETRLLDDGYTYHEEVVTVCCPGYAVSTTGNKLNEISKKCVPICRDKVKNSRCIKPPNTWICIENYQHDRRIDKCVLESCSCNNNGYCPERKDICHCYDGFTKNNITGQCEPTCSPSCENSICIANDICQCLDGHHKTAASHICEHNDLCSGLPCRNGECLITGECKCKAGFVKFLSYNGELQCDRVKTFVGKIMTTILGVPILLAACVLVAVYVIAKKKSSNMEEQEMVLINRQ